MKIAAANWKLHKSPKEAAQFFETFWGDYKVQIETQKNAQASLTPNSTTSVQYIFFPPALCAFSVAESIKGSPLRSGLISWGLQNSFHEGKGAFTGENSADVSKEMGAQWCLLGHSERRQYFNEDDMMIARKAAYVQKLALQPMVCVGETWDQRKTNDTQRILAHQIRVGLQFLDRQKPVYVAYEPVWAIGTGQVATLEQIDKTHQLIQTELKEMGFKSQSILYGGSVKPENANQIGQLENVAGFLVGGASLDPKPFLSIGNALY